MGKMAAKDICIIGHWCGMAERKIVGTLGMKPSSASGNFKCHFDMVVRKRVSDALPQAYTLPVGSVLAYVRSTGERGIHDPLCMSHTQQVLNVGA